MITNLSSQAFPDDDVSKALNAGAILKPLAMAKKPTLPTPTFKMARPKMPTVPKTAMPVRPQVRIGKSYLPGKGWLKAADAGAGALRRGVKTPGNRFKKMGGMSSKDSKMLASHKDRQRMMTKVRNISTPAGQTTNSRGQKVNMYKLPVEDLQAHVGAGALGVANHTGGRKGTREFFSASNPERMKVNAKGAAAVERHEMQHVAPNRSGWRLSQILDSGSKHMREEARSDAVAGTAHFRSSNPHLKTGYWQNMRSPGRRFVADKKTKMAAEAFGESGHADMYSRDSVKAAKKVQDNVNPRARVKQYAVRGAMGTAAVGVGVQHHRNKTGVSKMSPDPSSVHVLGNGGKKGRKPKYPDGIRLTKIAN